jgi:hypothetical protein
MSDEKPETEQAEETRQTGQSATGPQDPPKAAGATDAADAADQAKKDDLIETAIGLAVLGLGAALLSGGGGLGGIVRTVTRGPSQRTPPIAPHLNGVDDVLRNRRPW